MNDLQFMPHQEEVLNLTDDKNRCAYYLDMGLGKTFVGAEKMYLLNNTVNLIVCQKSKIDDWVDHMKTYYPEYRVMDLTKKSEGVNFRTLVETKDLYDQNIQIVGVINYDLVFRRKYIAHTLLRKSTCLEMEKKMTAIRNKVEAGNMMNYSEWCSINSYKGWLKYADTFRLYQKYVVPLLPYADDYYIRNIKPNTKKGLKAS